MRFTYRWIHIPTGQTGLRSVESVSAWDFVETLMRWNAQNPLTWVYAPISEHAELPITVKPSLLHLSL